MRRALLCSSALLGVAIAPSFAHAAPSPSACLVQTQGQLLSEFSDLVPAAAITPQLLRNFVCSAFALPPAPVSQSEAATIVNSGTSFAQQYFGGPNYSVGNGFTLLTNGKAAISGQNRGWERQTCELAAVAFPPATFANGCGQGNFYSFPYRYVYGGQDSEVATFNSFGLAPVASGVSIASIAPIKVINTAGIQQQVYQVNFSSPLSGSQVASLQAIVAAPGGPPKVETNNLFSAYVQVGYPPLPAAPVTTFTLAAGGTIPDVDPLGNFILVDCFTRAVPSDPEGPDPTAPVSAAPPTNNNACPLPTDFNWGEIQLPSSAPTASGNATLHFTSTTMAGYLEAVANGMTVLGSVAGVPAATTVSSTTPTTAVMSATASATLPAGTGYLFQGPFVRTYETNAAISGNTLTVASTAGVSGGWHVWGYGIPYGDSVASVVDGTHVTLLSPVLSGGVTVGSSTCTVGFGTPGPGCVTFSATDATSAGLTLNIDVVHLNDGLYMALYKTDADTLQGGHALEVVIADTAAAAPTWGIDPLFDSRFSGALLMGAANQPTSFGAFAQAGLKRAFVCENGAVTGSGPTDCTLAVTTNIALHSIQPSGTYVILGNKGGASASNQILLDADGNLSLAGNVSAASLTESALVTPVSSAAACTTGTINLDASFIYVCTASNAWKRVAISTW